MFKHLFNSIIKTSIFPKPWKSAKIIPIKKKGNCSSISNLRPISILSALSKVFEKLIKAQISKHVIDNNLLHPLQSGFRSNFSTNTALIKVHDDLAQAIDKRGVAILLLIDFAKAFDRVSHCRLVNKLINHFSFSQSAANLITSYLSDRCQAVFFNNVLSSFSSIKSGVPQGSVLGPLLFSLFINDLPNSLRYCSIHLFADDVQIYFTVTGEFIIDDVARKINNDLRSIFAWSINNLLAVNPSKTKAIMISRLRNPPQTPVLVFDGQIIEFFEKVDNLGVVFTSNLSWDAFVNTQCGKIYGALKRLQMVSRHFETSMKIKLFNVLFFLISCMANLFMVMLLWHL